MGAKAEAEAEAFYSWYRGRFGEYRGFRGKREAKPEAEAKVEAEAKADAEPKAATEPLYRYEELLFEYIPFFHEPHKLTTLQVTHTKSLEPIRMCAFTVLIRTPYLKHIDIVYFYTDL